VASPARKLSAGAAGKEIRNSQSVLQLRESRVRPKTLFNNPDLMIILNCEDELRDPRHPRPWLCECVMNSLSIGQIRPMKQVGLSWAICHSTTIAEFDVRSKPEPILDLLPIAEEGARLKQAEEIRMTLCEIPRFSRMRAVIDVLSIEASPIQTTREI
jgi:hypothetical protein